MRAIEIVVRLSRFSGAAADFGVSQSAKSQHVKTLRNSWSRTCTFDVRASRSQSGNANGLPMLSLKVLEMFPDVDVDLNKSIHTPVGTGGYDVNTFKDTITNIS